MNCFSTFRILKLGKRKIFGLNDQLKEVTFVAAGNFAQIA